MNNKEPCCFLDNVAGECSATNYKECPEKCPFRKTKAELQEGREKAAKRIATLPEHQQRAIREKYY